MATTPSITYPTCLKNEEPIPTSKAIVLGKRKLRMPIPIQWKHCSATLFITFRSHETREEDSSRIVMMRSTMSNEIVNTRTDVESRKLAKWVRHNALLIFKSCGLDLVNRCSHLCLLCHDFTKLWTDESNICMEKELVRACVWLVSEETHGQIFQGVHWWEILRGADYLVIISWF